VRLGEYKYILAPRPELYDLANDPAEHSNIASSNTSKAIALRAQLAKLLARQPQPPPAPAAINPQTEKLLASLGYLAPGPQGNLPNTGPDPKDRLPEFHLYEKAMETVADRHLRAAVPLFEQILSKDPGNTLARRDLAACYLDLHDYAQARSNFQQVVAAAPADYPSQFGLGIAAKHLRLLSEAREHLASACRLAPGASQCRLELDSLEKH
jgi:tetratricopeptide (TPR) repeat protein